MVKYQSTQISCLIDELGTHNEAYDGIEAFYLRNIEKYKFWYNPYHNDSPLYELIKSITVLHPVEKEHYYYPYKDASIIGMSICDVKRIDENIMINAIWLSDNSVDNIAYDFIETIQKQYYLWPDKKIYISIYYSLSKNDEDYFLNIENIRNYLLKSSDPRREYYLYDVQKINEKSINTLKGIVDNCSTDYVKANNTFEKIRKLREKYSHMYCKK